jgi:hypothetical protein
MLGSLCRVARSSHRVVLACRATALGRVRVLVRDVDGGGGGGYSGGVVHYNTLRSTQVLGRIAAINNNPNNNPSNNNNKRITINGRIGDGGGGNVANSTVALTLCSNIPQIRAVSAFSTGSGTPLIRMNKRCLHCITDTTRKE